MSLALFLHKEKKDFSFKGKIMNECNEREESNTLKSFDAVNENSYNMKGRINTRKITKRMFSMNVCCHCKSGFPLHGDHPNTYCITCKTSLYI